MLIINLETGFTQDYINEFHIFIIPIMNIHSYEKKIDKIKSFLNKKDKILKYEEKYPNLKIDPSCLNNLRRLNDIVLNLNQILNIIGTNCDIKTVNFKVKIDFDQIKSLINEVAMIIGSKKF